MAHFVNRLVFCMFAEDVGLLPQQMFSRMLQEAKRSPDTFPELAGELFRAMSQGGRVGFESVHWFNGDLFNDDTALPLQRGFDETLLGACTCQQHHHEGAHEPGDHHHVSLSGDEERRTG